MNALELDGVSHRYEDLDMRFDLCVPAGECLAVIGPSGAGKSTLLDLLAGFLKPSGGTVRILDQDMSSVEPADRPISMVFQDNNLFPHLTAEENVAIGLTPHFRIGKDVRAKARVALDRVGLLPLAGRLPSAMSGGERQRVAIARTVLRERPLLLLDEPFAALGPALRREMLSLVADLRSSAPTLLTIVMVTHHPGDARGFADRIAFLDEGQFRAVGPVAEILDTAHDPRIRAYLGAGDWILES